MSIYVVNNSSAMSGWIDEVKQCVSKCSKEIPTIYCYNSVVKKVGLNDDWRSDDKDNNLELAFRTITIPVKTHEKVNIFFVTNCGPTVGQKSAVFFENMIKRVPDYVLVWCLGLGDDFPHTLFYHAQIMCHITNYKELSVALSEKFAPPRGSTHSIFLLGEIVGEDMNSSRAREIKDEVNKLNNEEKEKVLQLLSLWYNGGITKNMIREHTSKYVTARSHNGPGNQDSIRK